MNIAVIDMDNLKNPFWGAGQARATREVCKKLAQSHQVTVYCSKYPGYQDYRTDGILYKHFGIVSKNPQLTNLVFLLSIPFIVSKIKADIIVENFTAPVSVSFAPLFTKIPVVGLPTMFNAKEFSKKYHLPFHWVEKLGLKFYKYLMPYSDVDSAKAIKINPNIMYRIISQGVSEEFSMIKHKKPRYILFLGRLDICQKGIDLLLEAYAKVANRIEYPLVIAGHGSDEEKIKTLIKKLKLENKVSIVGSAYGQKKEQMISEALFVAFPSRHDELSIWALEALASGLPLVAFDLPECRWITNGTALKAKPFDLEEYSKLLVNATDSKLNCEMRKNCYALSKHYSWDTVANEFEEFFKEIMSKEKNYD